MLVVGVLGGLYPAFFLSRFQPAQVLKANKSAAETPGTGRLRNALVVAQFAVSIGLIICTAVVYAQTVYARTVDPGYKRDHILQVDELSRYQMIGRADAVAEQTKRVPGVVAVGRTDDRRRHRQPEQYRRPGPRAHRSGDDRQLPDRQRVPATRWG